MDKIYLKSEDLSEIIRIPNNIELFREIWMMIIKNGFIFKKFILNVEVLNQVFNVKILDEKVQQQNVIQIIKYQNDEFGLPLKQMKYKLNAFTFIIKLTDFLKNMDNTSLIEMVVKKNYDNEFLDIVIPMSFIQYVIWKSLERETVIIESKERKQTGQKKKYIRKKKNEYKLIDCIKIYRKKNKNAGYTYTVDEFERRGYIRHYKNGKTVFVKPTTVKPKKKGEEKSRKEYKL